MANEMGTRVPGPRATRPLRLALYGAGRHSQAAHVPALMRFVEHNPGAIELVAVANRTVAKAERISESVGFRRVYPDLSTMLRSEKIDACISVAAQRLIADTTIALLSAGVPCLVEKPIAFSERDLDRVLEEARRSGTPHMVSLNRRFNPVLCSGIEWCARQGKIAHVTGELLRVRRLGPGFLVETGIHCVDTVWSVGGGMQNSSWAPIGMDSHGTTGIAATLHFVSGISSTVTVIPTAGVHKEVYTLTGGGFTAECRIAGPGAPMVDLWSNGQEQRHTPQALSGRADLDGCAEETETFLDGVIGRDLDGPTVFDVEAPLRFVLGVEASRGSG